MFHACILCASCEFPTVDIKKENNDEENQFNNSCSFAA